MTEWLRLDELDRLLASVDVFEPLTSPELRALARGPRWSASGQARG